MVPRVYMVAKIRNQFLRVVIALPPKGAVYLRDRMKSARSQRRERVGRASPRASPPRALFSPATAKRRGCIASLNWRIENNRAIPRGEEGRRGDEQKEERDEEVSKASTAERKTYRGRLVALYSQAWPREEKKVSGPTGPSLFPPPLLSPARPSATAALPTSSSWMSIYYRARPCGSLPGRALDLTPRLVKHHFHTTEKQFNSLVSLYSRESRHHPSSLSLFLSLPLARSVS